MTFVFRRLCGSLLSAFAARSSYRKVTTITPSLAFVSFSRSTQQRMGTATTEGSSATTAPAEKKKPIVQYIFLRRDLGDWPAGAMAAQAAHASVAAIAEALSAGSPSTQEYISANNLPHMTKNVFGVDSLEQLEEIRDAWNEQQFGAIVDSSSDTTAPSSYWWVEQPENVPTAFATWPVERTNKVSKVIKKMKVTYF